jgi:transposase
MLRSEPLRRGLLALLDTPTTDGTTFAYLEAWAPRVSCREHGVVVAGVPWARHDAGFTRAFEDQVAWLAVRTNKIAVAELMRIAWRTVGWICERVMAEQRAGRDLFAGLKRIGIDEISIRKGQRYLTVIVDHDTGGLVWAAAGRDQASVRRFLDLLGEERCQQLAARLLRHGLVDHRSDRRALPQRHCLLRPGFTSSS